MKYLIISSIVLSLLIGGCTSKKAPSDKAIITVSIAPQKYFVEQLIGKLIDVNVMIPQGSNHATYSPTPAQIRQLAKSDAYFKMGHLSFEATWQDKLKATNANIKWFDLSDGISMIHGDHHHHGHDHVCTGGVDPHTWTSPVEMKLITKNLKLNLITLYPQHKEIISANYEQFINEIDGLDERLRKLQMNKPGLTFMIFHPAYTYLAKAYGFNQITIEFEGKTPTPARLKSTIEEAQKQQIKTIYIQQEFDRSNAEVIAKEIGATTVQVNPLSEDWTKEMLQFISHLEAN